MILWKRFAGRGWGSVEAKARREVEAENAL